jgi:hypothetical protein
VSWWRWHKKATKTLSGYLRNGTRCRCKGSRYGWPQRRKARPSDAIAFAVLNDIPIFAAEDVLEAAGMKVPETVKGSPNRKGLEKIISSIREWKRKDETEMRQRRKQYHQRSQEDIARETEAAIDVLFGK